MPFTAQDITTVGMGGVSFLALLGILYFILQKIEPTLQEIKEELSNNQKVIENNTKAVENQTDAIKEIADSNNNIAKSIELQGQSLKLLIELIDKHDIQAKNIQLEITKISERTKHKEV